MQAHFCNRVLRFMYISFSSSRATCWRPLLDIRCDGENAQLQYKQNVPEVSKVCFGWLLRLRLVWFWQINNHCSENDWVWGGRKRKEQQKWRILHSFLYMTSKAGLRYDVGDWVSLTHILSSLCLRGHWVSSTAAVPLIWVVLQGLCSDRPFDLCWRLRKHPEQRWQTLFGCIAKQAKHSGRTAAQWLQNRSCVSQCVTVPSKVELWLFIVSFLLVFSDLLIFSFLYWRKENTQLF